MNYLAAAIFGAGLLATPMHALATGGVWCDVEDKNVNFHFKASQARDGTGGWWGIEGRVESLNTTLPTDIATFTIKDENLTERWWDGDDVRLIVQKNNADNQSWASVRVTVLAKAYEEATYRGPYTLEISNADGSRITSTGVVECSAD